MISLIRQLCIRNGNLSLKLLEPRLFPLVRGNLEACGNRPVGRRVDAAYEETGHTRHAVHFAASCRELLQSHQIGLGDLLISLLRENQGHVDVDPIGDQLHDRRNALWSGRHFNHKIFAADGIP